MVEKRRFTRIPIKFEASLTLVGKTHRVKEIKNLSIGGCLIPGNFEVKPETSCTFKIQLAGESSAPHINVEGKITRCNADGVSIHFLKINRESLFHLQNLVRYNAPDADIIEDEIKEHPGLR